jgi:hypothetical protein
MVTLLVGVVLMVVTVVEEPHPRPGVTALA